MARPRSISELLRGSPTPVTFGGGFRAPDHKDDPIDPPPFWFWPLIALIVIGGAIALAVQS